MTMFDVSSAVVQPWGHEHKDQDQESASVSSLHSCTTADHNPLLC